VIDLWNVGTLSDAIKQALCDKSELIVAYHNEAIRLIDDNDQIADYKGVKTNKYSADYQSFQEQTLTPMLFGERIRVWHYSRLLDQEVVRMKQSLVPSSLTFLKQRVQSLVQMGLLTDNEAEEIYIQSPFQKQNSEREGMLWAVTSPYHHQDPAVMRLLQNWGGESAYFCLTDDVLTTKLQNLGRGRIIEIEAGLTDKFNASKASGTVLEAWAKQKGVRLTPNVIDLAFSNSLSTTRIIKVHSEGDTSFAQVAITYP
jgi:hypothetical protein